MGIVSSIYIKKFVCRYDKEVGVPYHSYLDFKGLHKEEFTFNNSNNIEIHYFYYYYDNYDDSRLLLFLHGIGPGHDAYLKEIETFAKKGFKVLTLDYQGCGYSKGKYLGSLNEPTRDVVDLLDYLKIDKEIILLGHSLGGYTALNIISLSKYKNIHKAVALAPFLDIKSLSFHFVKSKFVVNRIASYERKVNKEYFYINILDYLYKTKDKILYIQSEDDQMIPYNISLKLVEDIDNKNITCIKVNNKGHNPNYSESAVKYLNEVFSRYNKEIKDKKIKNDEDSIAYFKNVSLEKLVEQDENIIELIYQFIESK